MSTQSIPLNTGSSAKLINNHNNFNNNTTLNRVDNNSSEMPDNTVIDITNPTSKTTTTINNTNNDAGFMSKFEINQVIKTTKEASQLGRAKDVKFRTKQLKQILKLVQENQPAIFEALKVDLNKPPFEILIAEFNLLVNEIRELLHIIDDFVKPQHREKTILTACDQLYVKYEPLGTVLVMGAWNYPLLLSLQPMVGAMAAGNCCIVKMSEHAPAVARLLADLFPKYLDPQCYQVVNCDLDTTKYMLDEHKFDFIFYTGGGGGGKAVYETAAKTMTPVVLELGGKSPVYIDDDVCDRDAVWNRLFWGKFMNSGQTCIAPDYVLCSEKAQQLAKKHFAKCLKEFYNDDPVNSGNYAKIVNVQHFERLKKLLKESRIVHGGKLHSDKLTIEPALVMDASLDDNVMQDEIFGPILPFVTCSSVQKAIDIINSRPKPLALYVFSESKKIQNKFLENTSSGGLVINDVIVHISATSLPFGGVGNSGFGKYHGRHSMELFSNCRAVQTRSFNPLLEYIGKSRYPPYTDTKALILTQLGMNRKIWLPGKIITSCLAFATGAASMFAYQTFF